MDISDSLKADEDDLWIPLDALSLQIDFAVCEEGPELLQPIYAALVHILCENTLSDNAQIGFYHVTRLRTAAC